MRRCPLETARAACRGAGVSQKIRVWRRIGLLALACGLSVSFSGCAALSSWLGSDDDAAAQVATRCAEPEGATDAECKSWSEASEREQLPFEAEVVHFVALPDDTHTGPTVIEPVRRSIHDASELALQLSRRGDVSDEPPTKKQKRLAKKRKIPVGELHLFVGSEHRPSSAEEETPKPTVLRVYDERGMMQRRAVEQFADAMGVLRTVDVEPRLLALLYLIGRDFDRPVHLVSGHRPPEAASGNAWGHARGRAVDIHVPGISAAELREYCHARFVQVGVGYRPKTGLVHLDVRARTLHWTDFARPGQEGREVFQPIERADTGEREDDAAATEDDPHDPTLASLHLAPTDLYPSVAPPKDSELGDAPPETRRRRRKYHVVRKGDTVSEIASEYGVSAAEVLRWNKLKETSIIHPGDKLRVRK